MPTRKTPPSDRPAWRYHRGEWTEIPNPLEPGQTFPADLVEHGFAVSESFFFGQEVDKWAWEVQVYATRPPVEGRHFAVGLYVAGVPVHIYVTDFPSLLQLLGELAPIAAQVQPGRDPE
jgi:hypothetical protein